MSTVTKVSRFRESCCGASKVRIWGLRKPKCEFLNGQKMPKYNLAEESRGLATSCPSSESFANYSW